MKNHRTLITGLGLFFITFVLYWPVTSFPFIAYDDQLYVYENPEVSKGLSYSGIKWAATASVGGNWHPVTMLSHMTDCSLFGRFAGGHHLTSLLFHAIDAILIWMLARRMTGSFWAGTLVAALFAWHPMNVESVAWIAERKNVLSSFFLLLTLLAYFKYVEKPTPGKYILTLVLFALGLMAKPMLVTLPCLLLVLDYWPLRRLGGDGLPGSTWRKLILEKLPFFVLTGAAIVLTLKTQNASGAVKSLHDVSLELRLLNVPVAYATYVFKAIFPVNLCFLYPLPDKYSAVLVAASIFVLVLVAGLMIHWRRRFPWFIAGWLWFLGTLVPVIGIVQAGDQAIADRYAYVPILGLFLMAACALEALVRARPHLRFIIAAAASAFVVVCLILSHYQIRYWRSSVELYRHALVVEPKNAIVHDLLGAALSGENLRAEANEQYRQAVNIAPGNVEYQYHLGLGLIEAGQFEAAEAPLRAAIQLIPDNAILHDSLGVALSQQNKTVEAMKEYVSAIQIQPDYAKPYFNLGKSEHDKGDDTAALANFTKAIQLDPDWPEALDQMALILATCSRVELRQPGEALKLSQYANELTGNQLPAYLRTLARTYAAVGDFSNAVVTAKSALKDTPTNELNSIGVSISRELKAYQDGKLPGGE
jgi:Flp pilus assembly protein TadD